MLLIEAVNARIDELCREKGITRYRLAEKSALNRSLLTMMKSTGTVKLSTVSAICDGLGISLKDFFVVYVRKNTGKSRLFPRRLC